MRIAAVPNFYGLEAQWGGRENGPMQVAGLCTHTCLCVGPLLVQVELCTCARRPATRTSSCLHQPDTCMAQFQTSHGLIVGCGLGAGVPYIIAQSGLPDSVIIVNFSKSISNLPLELICLSGLPRGIDSRSIRVSLTDDNPVFLFVYFQELQERIYSFV